MIENTTYEHEKMFFGKYEFIAKSPGIAITSIVLLCFASVFGTFGNVFILLVVSKTKYLHCNQSIFIVNLAISDMFVTLIADPMSIIGKIEGRPFFDNTPLLCKFVGKLCTMSCISSLGSIAFLSINRYVFICHNSHYKKIFSRCSCIIMCTSLYCVGLVFVLLNIAGIGDHRFDDKSLECIWNRMATYSYTVIFSVGLVWIPLIVVGISYLSLFSYVRHKQKFMPRENLQNNRNPSLKLAKTIFIVYAAFAVCWIPFAVLLVADIEDSFPQEIHLVITVFAHFHPSINWFIYYMTNNKFKAGFNKLVGCHQTRVETFDLMSSNRQSEMSQRIGRSVAKVFSVTNDNEVLCDVQNSPSQKVKFQR